MQIFQTNLSLARCAKNLCDQHLRAQIKELGQILSTVLRVWSGLGFSMLPKNYNPKHPVIAEFWAGGIPEKARFLNCPRLAFGMQYMQQCLEEYEFRFGKVHAYANVLSVIINTGLFKPTWDASWDLIEIHVPIFQGPEWIMDSVKRANPTKFGEELVFLAYKRYVELKYLEWGARVDRPIKPTYAGIPMDSPLWDSPYPVLEFHRLRLEKSMGLKCVRTNSYSRI